MPIDKHKIIINVDGKKFEIPIPKDSGLEIREQQNPECNKGDPSKGIEPHICGLFNGQLVCLKIKPKEDENGRMELLEMSMCSKSNQKNIKIEG